MRAHASLTNDDEQLIELVNDLKQKLQKKTEDLTRTRQRLNKAKLRIQRLRGIVHYQRQRIITLHN